MSVGKVLSNHWIHLSSSTLILDLSQPSSILFFFITSIVYPILSWLRFLWTPFKWFYECFRYIFSHLSIFGGGGWWWWWWHFCSCCWNSSSFANEYGLHSYKVNKFTCLLLDPLLIVWDERKKPTTATTTTIITTTNKQFAAKALAWLIWFYFLNLLTHWILYGPQYLHTGCLFKKNYPPK